MPASDREARRRRQDAIVDLITERKAIHSQSELQEMLAEMGIPSTQSSISRDLQELGIKRVKGRYVLRVWRDVDQGSFEDVVGFVNQVHRSGPYITVMLTSPGAAKVVAWAVDAAGWPEVLGTVAGEDTIFVTTASEEGQTAFIQRLKKYLKKIIWR
ncbi:MAG TPA: arginine repressor [Thermoanaerobaculia bacterium]|nr:arginine repressor [Thermoanaerobaculia bacterium]